DVAADHAHPLAVGGIGFLGGHRGDNALNRRRFSHPAPACGSAMQRSTSPRGPSTRLRPGLYLVTPDDPDPARLLARVAPVLPFASCLQLRNKAMDAAALRRAGERLRKACCEARVPFIVNDDAALTAELQADGVHLGEDDGDIASARALLGDAAI